MKQLRKFGLLFAALAALSAHAQEVSYCDQWKQFRAPVVDMPPVSFAGEAATCNELDIYYNSKGPDRFHKARWCAFASVGEFRDGTPRQKTDALRSVGGNDSSDNSLRDPVANLMLAMLYANGEGIPANIKIARHYACQSGDWFGPEAVAGSIKPGVRFEECDEDAGSGRIVNFACIGLRQDQVSSALKKQLLATRSVVPAELRENFAALVAAYDHYRKANEAEEPNGTSGAVQSGMSNEIDLDREWLDELKMIAVGRAPAADTPATNLAAADKKLNATYQSNLQVAHENPGCGSCTTEEQYRASARAWLVYREAWVGFGTKRWPEVVADQWRAWLTEERNRDH